jgi:hypothetical protein
VKARPSLLPLFLAAIGIPSTIPVRALPQEAPRRRVSYDGAHPLARKARSGKSRKTTPLEPRVRFNGLTPEVIGRRRLTRRERKALKAKAARR